MEKTISKMARIVALLVILDSITTYIGIMYFGAIEANNVLLLGFAKYGIGGALVLKTIVGLTIPIGIYLMNKGWTIYFYGDSNILDKSIQSIIIGLLGVVVVIYFYTVLNNLFIITIGNSPFPPFF